MERQDRYVQVLLPQQERVLALLLKKSEEASFWRLTSTIRNAHRACDCSGRRVNVDSSAGSGRDQVG